MKFCSMKNILSFLNLIIPSYIELVIYRIKDQNKKTLEYI